MFIEYNKNIFKITIDVYEFMGKAPNRDHFKKKVFE